MALSGAVMPFVLAGFLLLGLGPVELEGNEVRLLGGGYFALVGVILVYFAIMIIVDEKRRVNWGALVVAGNVMVAVLVVGFNAGLLLSSSSALPEGLTLAGLLVGQALGIAGGLMSMLTRTRKQKC